MAWQPTIVPWLGQPPLLFQWREIAFAGPNAQVTPRLAHDLDLDAPPRAVALLVGRLIAERVLRAHLRADLVVHRGEAFRLLLADALDHMRELVLAVARRPHLRVEVHDDDVDGIDEPVEKLDRRGFGEPDVLPHALADIEQHAQVQRRARMPGADRVAGRKEPNRLLPAVFVDFKVVGGQFGDQTPFALDHRRGDVDQVDAGAKQGDLRAGPYSGKGTGDSDEQSCPDTARNFARLSATGRHGQHSTPR